MIKKRIQRSSILNVRRSGLKTDDVRFALSNGLLDFKQAALHQQFGTRKEFVVSRLEAFACEKIGLMRPVKMNPSGRATTDVAQIKGRLLKGIRELEKQGYIRAVRIEERFTKNGVTKWEIHFERQLQAEDQQQGAPEIEVEEMRRLEGRLVGHVVSRTQARRLCPNTTTTGFRCNSRPSNCCS